MKRALIIGCGYVGSALGLSLVDAGWQVWGLRRSGPCPQPMSSLRCDLSDRAALRETFASVEAPLDAVIYAVAASGFDEAAYRAAYVDGLDAALEALAEPPARLLFASSTSVYGQQDGAWVDESSVAEPVGFSGVTMLEAERLAAKRQPGATVVRFGGIYGPGRTRLVDRVRDGHAIAGPDAPFRNRIHRDDCAGVLHHLLTLDAAGPRYLAVDNEPASMADVEAWLCEQLDRDPDSLKHDQPTGARRGTNKRCFNARLRATGYQFRYPSFRDGYRDLL